MRIEDIVKEESDCEKGHTSFQLAHFSHGSDDCIQMFLGASRPEHIDKLLELVGVGLAFDIIFAC